VKATQDRRARTVAVVGAGIAGAACARALLAAGIDVRLLDRGRAPGGRMASRTLAGRPVDLGASYLTAAEPAFVAVVADWVARGLARPWTDTFATAGPGGLEGTTTGPLRYGAPRGLRSLVEDLTAGLPLSPATEVRHVGPGPTVDGTPYDAVVLALPDPQAARLLDPALVEERAAVDRGWEPVLALAAGFERRSWELDCAFGNGADVLGWVADDGRRRGDGAPVLVAHSTSAFAAPRLQDPSAAAPEMVAALQALLGLSTAPSWTHVHRWSSARPAQPREQPHFLAAAGVGLCGDGWGAPRVETAWLSGTSLGTALAARLGGSTEV
jgi:renalase